MKYNITKVGVCGEKYSYAHITALNFFGENLEFIFFDSFSEVCDAILKNKNLVGVLPYYNTTAGTVSETFENLIEKEIFINDIIDTPINHCLLGIKNKADIEYVVSHPQAIFQCQNYIKTNNYKSIYEKSTSSGAKFVADKKDENIGAIASELAGKVFGLKILDRNINDSDVNKTRFGIVLNRLENLDGKKCSLVFRTYNKAGALSKTLNIFAKNEINLCEIFSFPVKKSPFEFNFYVEFDGNIKDKNVEILLEELKEENKNVKLIGNY